MRRHASRSLSEKNKRRIPLQLEALEPRNPPGYLLTKSVIFSGLDDDGFARSSQSLPPPDFTQIETRAVTRSGSALTYETGIPSGVTDARRLAVAQPQVGGTDFQSVLLAADAKQPPPSSSGESFDQPPTQPADLTQNPLDLFLAAMASQPRGGGSAGFQDTAAANQGAGFVAAAAPGSNTAAPGSGATPPCVSPPCEGGDGGGWRRRQQVPAIERSDGSACALGSPGYAGGRSRVSFVCLAAKFDACRPKWPWQRPSPPRSYVGAGRQQGHRGHTRSDRTRVLQLEHEPDGPGLRRHGLHVQLEHQQCSRRYQH